MCYCAYVRKRNLMKTFPYVERLYPNTPPTTDPRKFDDACELFVEGKVKESIHAQLDYYNPWLRLKCDDDQKGTGQPVWTNQPKGGWANLRRKLEKPVYGPGRRFTIPHGSLILYLEITESEFRLRIPFVRLPKDSSRVIAFLREVNEVNYLLDWFQLVLREEELICEYSCPLPVANPDKISRILSEACLELCYKAEELVYHFGGEWVEKPRYLPCPASDVERVIKSYRALCAWLEERLQQPYAHLLEDYIEELFELSFVLLLFFTRTGGYLEQRISEIFGSSPELYEEGESRGIEHLRKIVTKLHAITDDELRSYLHRKPHFILLYQIFSLGEFQNNVSRYLSPLVSPSSYESECAFLSVVRLMLLQSARQDLPSKVNRIIDKALRAVMGVDSRKAIPVLLKACNDLLDLPVIGKGALQERVKWEA